MLIYRTKRFAFVPMETKTFDPFVTLIIFTKNSEITEQKVVYICSHQ